MAQNIVLPKGQRVFQGRVLVGTVSPTLLYAANPHTIWIKVSFRKGLAGSVVIGNDVLNINTGTEVAANRTETFWFWKADMYGMSTAGNVWVQVQRLLEEDQNVP